jgi:hypothetical protein
MFFCDKFLAMLEKELETAVALARQAGKIILDFYETGFEIEEKIFADNFSEPRRVSDFKLKISNTRDIPGLR